MTIDQLPGKVVAPSRDDLIEKHKRSFRLRVQQGNPDIIVDTGPGTQPDIDARVAADMLLPLYAAAITNGKNLVLEEARGDALKQWGAREGVGDQKEAQGASGFVAIQASPGGTTLAADDELKHKDSGLRFRVIRTDNYGNGDPCEIVGKDTGPDTNLAAGTQLEWSTHRPGCGDFALVTAASDGSGLIGGRDKESEEEYQQRILDEKRNRAASGNDAEYQLEAQNTPSVAMQKAFTHPAIRDPGTTCLVFTMLPSHPGGSRLPNSAQVSLVESHLAGEFPADDGLFMGLIAEEPCDVAYGITWTDEAAGWIDVTPWPLFYAVAPVSGPGAIRVSGAADSTHFTLATSNANYTGIRQPTVGQTIGFYDTPNFTYRRKRILSVTGTGPWVVVCDTTNNASDTSYTPALGQRAMPWSDSLEGILFTAADEDAGKPASGVLAYFDTLGPGEQTAAFYDDGTRQRRQPPAPRFWPHETTTRGLSDAITADDVEDLQVLEGDGVAPSVGTPGVLSNILKLRYLACFPEPT